jgi:hypothetical protein
VCENPSGEDWVPREGDISQNPEGGDEEGGGENPGEEARIRKLHRMKERRPSPQKDYLKGLSHEMDLAFDDMLWLVLGINRGRGHLIKIFWCANDFINKKCIYCERVYVGLIVLADYFCHSC